MSRGYIFGYSYISRYILLINTLFMLIRTVSLGNPITMVIGFPRDTAVSANQFNYYNLHNNRVLYTLLHLLKRVILII